jgi:hypothetical protein
MTEAIEFGRRDIAESFREDYPDALCSEDDRRLKTVRFSSDAPEEVLQEARQAAAQSRGDRTSRKEQADLTRKEKKRLDFSKDGSSVLKAQWVKGTLQANGIKDWEARYDPKLTVDEHVSMIDEWKRDQRGSERLDAEESEDEANARRARQAQRAQDAQCNHALDECEYGDPEACEFLGDVCGYDEDKIERILESAPDEEAISDGQVTFEELDGTRKGALKRAWGGYKSAVGTLDRELTDVAEAFADAEQAAKAIAAIEDDLVADDQVVGSDEFQRLAEHHATLADLCERHHGLDHGQPGHSETATTQTGRLSDAALAAREPEQPSPPQRPGFFDEQTGTVSEELVARAEPAFPRELETSTPDVNQPALEMAVENVLGSPPDRQAERFENAVARYARRYTDRETAAFADELGFRIGAAQKDINVRQVVDRVLSGDEPELAGVEQVAAEPAFPRGLDSSSKTVPVGTWGDAVEVVRAMYGDDYGDRVEFAADVRRAVDGDLPRSLADEGVTQPILRFQDVSPRDALRQIEERAGKGDAEKIRQAVVEFARSQQDEDVLDRPGAMNQRTLAGGRQATEGQASFANAPEQSADDARYEAEHASEFGTDDRTEAGRGATGGTETEPQTLGEATGGFDARDGGQAGFDSYEDDNE